MMFHVGQKVASVVNAPHRAVKKGDIFTIWKICECGGLLLAEIETSPNYCCFDPNCFRPVVTTDISIFETMLVPTPKEKVEA